MVTIVLIHVNMIRLPHHDIDTCTSFSSCQGIIIINKKICLRTSFTWLMIFHELYIIYKCHRYLSVIL
jgi:transposase